MKESLFYELQIMPLCEYGEDCEHCWDCESWDACAHYDIQITHGKLCKYCEATAVCGNPHREGKL